jgi:hypothetical protein
MYKDDKMDKEKKIEYTVDGERQFTDERKLTPTQILTNAHIDPTKYYLVEIEGNKEKESFKDKPNVEIHMHEHMKFVSVVIIGPIPQSS